MRFRRFFVVFLLAVTVAGGLGVLRITRTWADGPSPSRQGAFQVWVSSDGSDRDECDRRSPCKTFAGAMQKVAAGGQINVVDAGEYGPVTVTKSVTVNGEGALASVQA